MELRPDFEAVAANWDRFWQQRGFHHQPQLRTSYHWQDLDETQPSAKPMSFWLKEIHP